MTTRIWICPQCAEVAFKKPEPRTHYCTGTRVAPIEMDEYVTAHVADTRHGWLNEARTNPEPQGQWQVNSHRRSDGYHVDRGGGYWGTTPCLVIPEPSDV